MAMEAAKVTRGPSSMGPETTIRGPVRRWAATRFRACNTESRSLPMSRMPDAVGDEHRQDIAVTEIAAPAEVRMGMHVPETGNDIHAFDVDDVTACRDSGRWQSHPHDVISVDDDRLAAAERAVRHVDDRRVGDRQRWCRDRRTREQEDEENALQDDGPDCHGSDRRRPMRTEEGTNLTNGERNPLLGLLPR